ncbi:MAG TPA: hypothetical protein DD670_06295 [Planctomycetaceae bacterium]|nr:hypothetical protein [Planctomycetaceae bacterium]
MNFNILRAVFVRNFVSFYSSLTGYAFIALFVLLNAVVNFGSDMFYDANLANLDILTALYPFIMLLFVPAITMGLWAGERRDGTDELLLSMPGSDFDIVLGKYLAAVAIYTVALLFSLVPNYILLNALASPDRAEILHPSIDVGLFFGTYFGYWLMGLPMLAIGMVASFLTRNLTLAWLLGSWFNVVLAVLIGLATLTMYLAGVFGNLLPVLLEISDNLTAPCRGTLSLMGFVFYAVTIVVMLYLCMVLIGQRHWGRRGRALMGLHYLVRTLALAIIGTSAVVFARQHEVRVDVTTEQLTSLSKETKRLLTDLEGDRVVLIEAFVSPNVPESYLRTKKNLENTIRELAALNPSRIRQQIIQTEDLTKEATIAEDRYGITPREVLNRQGGKYSVERIFMGVSIRSGLNRVTIPFLDRGIPIEYELVRSICTVLEENRKKIGVLLTDAPLFGQASMQGTVPPWPIIEELEKQFEVVRVDASQPIDPGNFDVLLAVQPSSLGPEPMQHFVDAVRSGVPTAIFEDPAPLLAGVPGTGQPRRSAQDQMMMMFQQPQAPPKGEIKDLWELLGVRFAPGTIVWQKYNPYPKVEHFGEEPEFVFVDKGSGTDRPFNPDDPITSGLQQLLFPFPGTIVRLNVSPLEFEPLVETGTLTGTVELDELMEMMQLRQQQGVSIPRPGRPTGEAYVMAARIRGEIKTPAADPTELPEGESSEKPTVSKINVVLVADIDMLTQPFFELRRRGDDPEVDVYFEFDNITFVLNVLDELADDSRFIDIRKRRRQHRPLARIEKETEKTREDVAEAIAESQKDFEAARQKEQDKLNEQVRDLEQRIRAEKLDLMEIARRVAMVQQAGQKRLNAEVEKLERSRDQTIKEKRTEEKEKVMEIRLSYKKLAWLLAPIPPILLGLLVFLARYTRESTHARQREKAIRSRQG